jgi:hypothetical protein
MTENKGTRGSVGKMFFMVKIEPWFMGLLVYSHKGVVTLSVR